MCCALNTPSATPRLRSYHIAAIIPSTYHTHPCWCYDFLLQCDHFFLRTVFLDGSASSIMFGFPFAGATMRSASLRWMFLVQSALW